MKLSHRIVWALAPALKLIGVAVVMERPHREFWENGFRRIDVTGPARLKFERYRPLAH